jgi:hypothetical protein
MTFLDRIRATTALLEEIVALVKPPSDTGRTPGGAGASKLKHLCE